MRQLSALSLLLPSLALGVGACAPEVSGRRTRDGGTTGGGGDSGVVGGGAITIDPAQASVVVKGGPGMQQFRALGRGGRDVTDSCTWQVDPKVGTIAGGLFTSLYPLQYGGSTPVTALCDGQSGGASLTIVYSPPDVVDPSAGGGGGPGAFGGPASTDPSAMPRVVYPFDGTMLARNIYQLNLQWTAGSGQKQFHVRVSGDTIDANFYVGSAVCGGGTQCKYAFKDDDWQTIALSAAGKRVVLTIDGTTASGAAVGTSAPLTLNFSPEDVKGGLYYFSPSIRGLKRLPFGARTATDFIRNGNETNCVGCHTVSRDGKKVAATFGGGDGYAGIVDGANGQRYIAPPDTSQSRYAWNFASFSPDGSQLVTNWQGKLAIRDGQTGALVREISPQLYGAKAAVMPEWSPDGQKIAFVGIPPEGNIGREISTFGITAGDWIIANAGSIMVMPVNGGQFGPAEAVVPSVRNMEYNFYPSWSPDSQWIVFATGTYPGSSPTAAANGVDTRNRLMSYDQDTARLRLVKASGGVVIELTAATHAQNRTSSWPKFTPFIQNGGKLVFITFSSRFNYGFIVGDKVRPQIWMSAIDLDKAATELGQGDPSFAPFWLPFQDPNQANHSTIWTNEVACSAGGGDCPPEFTCENGMCVPRVG